MAGNLEPVLDLICPRDDTVREAYAAQLAAAGGDAVLAAIAEADARLRTAAADRARLIAYARRWNPGRPYTHRALGEAIGKSETWIRQRGFDATAVSEVEQRLGTPPLRAK